MRCIAINLPHQSERRRMLEASFAAATPAGWSLEVLPATAADVAAAEPGCLSPGEKGCFTSHLRALELTLKDPNPVWVVEDDVAFAKCAFEAVNAALRSFSGEILFTNVGAASPQDFLSLHHWYSSENFRLIELSGVQIYGATSYIVAGKSKKRIWEIMKGAGLDTPYDLVLRHLVNTRQVTASVTMPFLTDLAPSADVSDLRSDPREAVRHAMRRLFFIERDIQKLSGSIGHIDANIKDATARLVGRLVGASVAADYSR